MALRIAVLGVGRHMGQFPVGQKGIVTCLLTHDDGGPAVKRIVGEIGISQDDQITQIDLGITEITFCIIAGAADWSSYFGLGPPDLQA